jgi:hypothetical protein
MIGLHLNQIETSFKHMPKGTQITLRALASKEADRILGKKYNTDEYRLLCATVINSYLAKQPITLNLDNRSVTILPQNYYKKRI